MVNQTRNLEAAVAAIRTCKTMDSLDAELARFDLREAGEIIDCLNRCMYNPERFFSSGGGVSIEDDMEMTKQIFLAGTWRLNEFYERMGIPSQKAESVHA